MEQLTPDESPTMQLSKLRYLLKELQENGEDAAMGRGMHIHSWLDTYVSDMGVSEADKTSIIVEFFNFYNSETMTFEDWQDKVALIPLQLLVLRCYPSWDTVTPAHIEKCLEIAGGKNSERHSQECFVTGDDVADCFVSEECAAKKVKRLGKDLAVGLTALELISVREHDIATMKRAKEGVQTIGTMFVSGGIYTKVNWEKFIDDVDHDISLALNPDMYDLNN